MEYGFDVERALEGEGVYEELDLLELPVGLLYDDEDSEKRELLVVPFDAGNGSGLALKFRSNLFRGSGDANPVSGLTFVIFSSLLLGSGDFCLTSKIVVALLATEEDSFAMVLDISCTVSLRRGTWRSSSNCVLKLSAATLASNLLEVPEAGPAKPVSNRLRPRFAGLAL